MHTVWHVPELGDRSKCWWNGKNKWSSKKHHQRRHLRLSFHPRLQPHLNLLPLTTIWFWVLRLLRRKLYEFTDVSIFAAYCNAVPSFCSSLVFCGCDCFYFKKFHICHNIDRETGIINLNSANHRTFDRLIWLKRKIILNSGLWSESWYLYVINYKLHLRPNNILKCFDDIAAMHLHTNGTRYYSTDSQV
jgi:hypothetical protein